MLGITGTLVVETGAPGGAPWRALPLGRRVAPRGAAVPPCAPPRAPLDEPPPAAAAAADDAIVFAWESSTARAPPRRRAAGGDGVPLLPSRPMHTPVYWDAGWTLIVSLRHAASLPRAPDAALRPPRMPLRVFCGGMFYLAGFFATVGGALWLGDKSATRRRRLACDQLARLFRAWYGVLNDAALGVPPALPRTPPELAAMGFRPWLPMPDAVGALPYLCPPAGDSTPLRQPPPYALAGGFLYAPGAARGALSHYVLIERLLGGAIARRRAAAAAHEGEETAFWVREQARGADGMALEGVTRTEDNILRNLAYPSGVSSASGGGGGGGASGWLPQPNLHALFVHAPPCIAGVLAAAAAGTHPNDGIRTFAWPHVFAAVAGAGLEPASEDLADALDPTPDKTRGVREYWLRDGNDGEPMFAAGCSSCAHYRARTACPFVEAAPSAGDIEDLQTLRCAEAMRLPPHAPRHPGTRWRMALQRAAVAASSS